MNEKKYIYFFGNGKAEGDKSLKNFLGGKGGNLAEMSALGLPVPSGFTISTEVCDFYNKNNKTYPEGLDQQVKENMIKVEEVMRAKFNDKNNPLLFSVRSGARVSMPGMMDTILNLGLNDSTIEGIIKKTGDERFVFDSYRRFIQMYANVVMEIPGKILEKVLEEKKEEKRVALDTELTKEDLQDLVVKMKARVKEIAGKELPFDPWDQLWGAIGAVFESWNTPRATVYRKLNNISDHWGTAVNVQAMVFGNMGNDCATGVAFTRNPSTGEKAFYGEFLVNAQGEDVVAGIRTPHPLNKAEKGESGLTSLEEVMPECYQQLENIFRKLEDHYRDMQDIEFTIQKKKLWMLQTRSGKRTALAAVKIAVDMVEEGLVSKKEAIMRVEPEQLDQLLHPIIDPKSTKNVIAKGLPASPGAAVGSVVFNSNDAQNAYRQGEEVILLRIETSPDDIEGMDAAMGILTSRGGMTSHAAVVARGMGKCCVSGCSALKIDYEKEEALIGGRVIKKGDFITLDGSTGEVILGKMPTLDPELGGDFAIFMDWADEIKKLKVRANADTPHDSHIAHHFGAEGIGLCRTEHMFFAGDRITAFREMILAENAGEREKALAKILPMQKGDFIKIFREMKGLPVTIRLLDPPLHEFLPQSAEEIARLAGEMGISQTRLKAEIEDLRENNPMLGHRGCRLGIIYPEITEMQAKAIFEAAQEILKEGIGVMPEVMVPLVGHVNELEMQRKLIDKIAKETMDSSGIKFDYLVGTMIELPRAALTAEEIGRKADFFSFGTNDLTQTTFGLSRDDAGKFLPSYLEKGILKDDPFITLDQEGVGQLVKMGIENGKKSKSDLKVGICGEHGGDPRSVEFFHQIGLDYVSCSPYRVPIARLAAAQAVLKE